MQRGIPAEQPGLMNEQDHAIISRYGAEYRGIVQYYLLAGDVGRLDRLRWVMVTSLLKTLAGKYDSTVSKMARKYAATIQTPHGQYRCMQVRVDRGEGRKPLVATFGGIPLKRQQNAVLRDRVIGLMAAARKLTPPLRAVTCETAIGLMASTGLRIGEALGLDRHDVDLDDGVLHVRIAKQHREREVPMHPSTTEALRAYVRLRDQLRSSADTPAFFLNMRGGRLGGGSFREVFSRLIREVGLEGHGQRVRPRPHDLRHAFAVRTLLDWHRTGSDVQRQLPRLATFLGHAHTQHTHWYLEAVPELLELVGRRLDGAFEEAR